MGEGNRKYMISLKVNLLDRATHYFHCGEESTKTFRTTPTKTAKSLFICSLITTIKSFRHFAIRSLFHDDIISVSS